MKKSLVLSMLGALALGVASVSSAQAATGACLITKNNTNPFFVKMKEGAEQGAAAAGVDLKSFAGEKDGDAAPQITAIENCVAAGVKGILITPSNDDVGPALKAARAAGILVISLDTPLGDPEGQDMTFATDNFEAGLLIGKWAKAQLGDKAADAKIAMLDINKDNGVVTVSTAG
jgi:fructose transport system substrate-binding protein